MTCLKVQQWKRGGPIVFYTTKHVSSQDYRLGVTIPTSFMRTYLGALLITLMAAKSSSTSRFSMRLLSMSERRMQHAKHIKRRAKIAPLMRCRCNDSSRRIVSHHDNFIIRYLFRCSDHCYYAISVLCTASSRIRHNIASCLCSRNLHTSIKQ